LFLAEKFAVSYWEEEHKLQAAQEKLLNKYWYKNRGATPRVDNTLKMAKHYACPRLLHRQPLTNILPFPVRQNITLFQPQKSKYNPTRTDTNNMFQFTRSRKTHYALSVIGKIFLISWDNPASKVRNG